MMRFVNNVWVKCRHLCFKGVLNLTAMFRFVINCTINTPQIVMDFKYLELLFLLNNRKRKKE